MKEIYIKNDGIKETVAVSDELAEAMAEMRRAWWRIESTERYYREASIDAMPDCDERIISEKFNPEAMMVAAEDKQKRQTKLSAAYNALTARQKQVVKLLIGKSVTETAALLGVSKQSISDIRTAVQKKFEVFL
ncbi:MAG: hypothetical protein FWD58_06625 [Firmicutes bacterium]|nr:hypothetical protein [Bacillota bacterium]